MITYWKKHKDGKWYEYETAGKTPKVKETVKLTEEFQVHKHTLEYKGVHLTFTSRCGYDRGPGRQRKLDKIFKIAESL